MLLVDKKNPANGRMEDMLELVECFFLGGGIYVNPDILLGLAEKIWDNDPWILSIHCIRSFGQECW